MMQIPDLTVVVFQTVAKRKHAKHMSLSWSFESSLYKFLITNVRIHNVLLKVESFE